MARPGQARDLDEARTTLDPVAAEGRVITDLASIRKVNCRAVPSGIRSVYFEVSSRVWNGWSPSFSRRSHLMFVLPSKPGSSRRSG